VRDAEQLHQQLHGQLHGRGAHWRDQSTLPFPHGSPYSNAWWRSEQSPYSSSADEGARLPSTRTERHPALASLKPAPITVNRARACLRARASNLARV
jgi:hypothetical protein